MTSPLMLSMLLAAGPATVHDFTARAIDGKGVALSQYRGKVLLIVNTASECGYTPQYKGLEELYQTYRERGLEILAFPSNDFGGQEPGSNAEIKTFCERRYRTTFPLFSKISVKGPQADPLYRHLTALPQNGGPVTWNFNKFLVDPGGAVVAHLDSGVEPTSADLRRRIEELLPRR